MTGAVLDVYKRGTAKNAPVEVELRAFRDVESWDIRLLVEALGVPPHAPEAESDDALQRLRSEVSVASSEDDNDLFADSDNNDDFAD